MSNSRPQKKPKIKETKFEKICRLLREQNAVGIKRLNDKYWYYHKDDNGETPMRVLAREGNVGAVWFIIDNYYKHADDAVRGFAEAGLVDDVNALLTRKSSSDFNDGDDYKKYNETAPFVSKGVKRAVQGYAYAGLDDEVEKILKEEPGYLDKALQGHIRAERCPKVEEFVARGAKIHPKKRPEKIFQNEDHLNILLSLTDSHRIREELLRFSIGQLDVNRSKMLQVAADMHRIMQEYHLNYLQAKAVYALREKGELSKVRAWMLQGMQVVRPLPPENVNEDEEIEDEKKLPLLVKDIYFHITSMLLGLSVNDTKKVLRGVHANLFEHVMKANTAKYSQGLFGAARYFAETGKAVEHDENRRKIMGI